MDSIVVWFTENLNGVISKEAIVFIISMIPILELRGGLLASKLLGVSLLKANILCIIGNILPIPFILLLIRRVLQWMKTVKLFRPFALWLEEKGMSKSDKIKKYEFWGLTLFVGIPLPGTGAWTGSLAASLLDIDFKKAFAAELVGIAMATVIMDFLAYGLLGMLI